MMNLLDRPVPPLPAVFAAGMAPDLPAFESRPDSFGAWAIGRPLIFPRLAIVHTNAARVMSSVQGQINHGNRGVNNTKPHWVVADGLAVKTLPTNRRAIANSTGAELEESSGESDVSFWSLAIETRDTGTNADRLISDFVDDDAELVAIICAYESLIPGQEFPIEVPSKWNGAGVVAHTWPYGYPHYTTKRGKFCPGLKKIATLKAQVIPRAQQIRAAWLVAMTGAAAGTLTDTTPDTKVDTDMDHAIIWTDPRYHNTWLLGTGGAVHLTPATYAHYVRLGVPVFDGEEHDQMLATCMHQCGLSLDQLAPA